jgi:hypothetical protein
MRRENPQIGEEISMSGEPTSQHRAINSTLCPASAAEIKQPTSEPMNIASPAHNKDAIRYCFGQRAAPRSMWTLLRKRAKLAEETARLARGDTLPTTRP